MAFSNNRPFFGYDRRDGYHRNNPSMRNNSRHDGFFHDDNHRKMYNEPLHSPREHFDTRPLPHSPDFRNRPDMRVPSTMGRGSINRSCSGPPPQKRPNQPPHKNSFSKFRNLEEFKDFRRSLKVRRSIEEEEKEMNFPKRRRENDTIDFIFISANEILEFKDNIYLSLRKNLPNPRLEVDEICQMFSRFQYHLCYKDYNAAKAISQRKLDLSKKHGSTFHCLPCDCSFTDKSILDIHLRSGLHQQTSKIYAQVLKLGLDYFNHYTKLSSILVEAPISEKTGILISLNDDKVNYSQLDVTNTEKDTFVLNALEKAMGKYWPHPKSQYFCRCCNYSEFASQALLDRHIKSARHLDFDRNYKDAFCIICQHHYGDSEKMRSHMDTLAHNKASHVMEYTKKYAAEYWTYWHFKDVNLIPYYGDEDEKPALEKDDNTTTHDGTPSEDLLKEDPMQRHTTQLQQQPKYHKRPENLRIPFVDEYESPVRKQETFISSAVQGEQNDTIANVKIENNLDGDPQSDNFEKSQELPKDPSSLDIDVYKEYAMSHIKSPTKKEVVEEPSPEKQPEKKPNDLDEYIVPLTGFMCTVCHETLSDKEAAVLHKDTNGHKSNVKTHTLLFGP